MKDTLCLLLSFAMFACGGAQREVSAPAPLAMTSSSAPSSQGPEPDLPKPADSVAPKLPSEGPKNGAVEGSALETPLTTCGPRDSYQRIADFTCPDGSKPLGGDINRGRGARLGSSSPHMEGPSFAESHIVDIYRMKCGGEEQKIFVCMYHCQDRDKAKATRGTTL
jgi:hypothetical protein